ncbi:MAG: hypothetical protein R2706_01555 [Acidimicrobiales bacterium]
MGVDPGLQKDGVEAHLQELLAVEPERIEVGLRLSAPRVSDRDRTCRPALPRRTRHNRRD